MDLQGAAAAVTTTRVQREHDTFVSVHGVASFSRICVILNGLDLTVSNYLHKVDQ